MVYQICRTDREAETIKSLCKNKITVEINIQGQVYNRIGKILRIDLKKLKEL